jgi:hypothetical protein
MGGAEATVSKVVTGSSLDAVVAPSGELSVIFECFAAEIEAGSYFRRSVVRVSSAPGISS